MLHHANIHADQFCQSLVRVRLRLILCLTGLILATAIGCSAKVVAVANPVRPVKTMVVSAGSDLRTRMFPGKVDASKRVELAFQVSGLLVDLPVKEGERVARGEVIGQLRQDEFQARVATIQSQVDQAKAGLTALMQGERSEEMLRREAQVRSAEAQLANARAEYGRIAQLKQRRIVTQADYDVAETSYRVAQETYQSAQQLVALGTIGREEDILAQTAAVRGLEAQLVEANLNLQDSTLKAPYDGVIARRFVEQGQNVRAKEPVVRFQDVDEVEILVDVPETVMASDILTADIVQLTARISGAPGLEFPVQIREMAKVADTTTQTFSVRVAMQVPEGNQVLPGMTASILATYRRAQILGNRIFVPVAAISQSGQGPQLVWVIDESFVAHSREVKVGSAIGGDIEVLSGLSPGDRIAVAGIPFLREGMQVRDLGNALNSASLTGEGSTR